MEAGPRNSTRLWRPLLLMLCFLSTAINSYSLFTMSVEASSALGFQVELTPNSALARIASIDPGGAADVSGLRAGDLIHVRDLSPGDRYRLFTGVHPHEQIPVIVTRDTRTIRVLYRSGEKPAWRWDTLLWAAASFWLLGFAFLIAWRRAGSLEARILCTLLALIPAASGLQAGSWLTPSPSADLIGAMIGYALTVAQPALLVRYALIFGRPPSPMRMILSGLTYALCAAVAMYEAARLAMLWTGSKAWEAQTLGPDWHLEWAAAPYFLAIGCAIAGIVAARGKERARIAWSTASVGLYLFFGAFSFLAAGIFPTSARGTALVVAYEFDNVGSFLAPLGMTYALLNRRLLDIGFALNRVAIFSVVSFIVVGAFVLVEWALGSWLQQMNHTASLLAGAAVALALGLSIHVVNARVEHVLDRVFFRKRHEDEQAIRRFAHEAAYISDAQTLIARTVQVLEQHAEASFARLALDDGAGSFGSVSENDPAIVSLRTWHRVVDLHRMQTQLRGEFAYPMVARGRLVGALVLGLKRSEETYAPDESQAIEELARGVAAALDVLSQKQAASDNGLATEVRAMHAAMANGFAAINTQLEQVRRLKRLADEAPL